jgi:hypothetical protein
MDCGLGLAEPEADIAAGQRARQGICLGRVYEYFLGGFAGSEGKRRTPR